MEWDWNVVASVTPSLLKGLIVTVQATIVGAVLAYVLGLVIAILKMSGNKAVLLLLIGVRNLFAVHHFWFNYIFYFMFYQILEFFFLLL